MPLLTVVDLMEVAPPPVYPETKLFPTAGGHAECLREGEGWRVRRIISTRLADYLDPSLQPGAAFQPDSPSGQQIL